MQLLLKKVRNLANKGLQYPLHVCRSVGSRQYSFIPFAELWSVISYKIMISDIYVY